MEEEILMVSGDEFNPTIEKFTWSRPMVLALIEEYKKVEHEFKDSNIKKKHLWHKISQRLAERGYGNVSEDMCDKKWRNLKKTFKEIYIGQRATSQRTRWGFYNEVEDIFIKDPNIVNAANPSMNTKPVVTSQKIRGPDGQEMNVEVMEVMGNMDEDNAEEVEIQLVEAADEQSYATNDASSQPPAWFSQFLQQYQNDEQRRMEMLTKMHSDIVAIEEKKCALLAALIDRIGGTVEIVHTDNGVIIAKEHGLRIQ